MPTVQRVRELARPRKIKSAMHRREFEYRLNRLPLAPAGRLEDVGTTYGGWILPVDAIHPGWICYSIGAGSDVSFDLELIRRFGATVRSVEPVEHYVDMARVAANGEERFTAIHAALVDTDGPIRMQQTHDAQSQSLSAGHLYEVEQYVEVPGRTLKSLMHEHGDAQIDLLKLDVEGFEYQLLPQLDLVGMGVRVFTMQVHHNGSVAGVRKLLDRLQHDGFRLVGNRPNLKLTFIR